MSEPEVVEELVVKKHCKFKSAIGTLDIHCSDNIVGAWLYGPNSSSGNDQFGLYVMPHQGPALVYWPPKSYTKDGKCRIPFGFSKAGLQVPHPDGSFTILPLEKLAALVKRIAAE